MAHLPNLYLCNACGERFPFAFRDAVYYLGAATPAPTGPISGVDIFDVPTRPAWCRDCDVVCIVEDIAPLRAFENAYGAVRAGGKVEYPFVSEWIDPQEVKAELQAYLQWRMSRRHVARALCCGRSHYQLLDVKQPLIKHQECDFGFITGQSHIGSYNGYAPGVRSPANMRVYDSEGELIGRLTWWDQATNTWTVEPAAYPPIELD